jgi:hypothetical protein
MALLELFVVSYFSVFVLGFQSRNINSGQFALAAMCSIGIGLSNAYVWRHITMANASWAEWITYSVAGGVGITSAMWFHRRFITKDKPRG